MLCLFLFFFFFFNDPPPTAIYTLSLHDALPIYSRRCDQDRGRSAGQCMGPERQAPDLPFRRQARSEEHTSELQSPYDLVCRLLLEKKKKPRQLAISLQYKLIHNHTRAHESCILQ